MDNFFVLIYTIVGGLLMSNGVIVLLLKRNFNKNDKVNKLCDLNDKQGKELVLMSTTMDSVLETLELFIDALHEKNILNGNSIPIKQKLKSTRQELNSYSKQVRDDALFIKGD